MTAKEKKKGKRISKDNALGLIRIFAGASQDKSHKKGGNSIQFESRQYLDTVPYQAEDDAPLPPQQALPIAASFTQGSRGFGTGQSTSTGDNTADNTRYRRNPTHSAHNQPENSDPNSGAPRTRVLQAQGPDYSQYQPVSGVSPPSPGPELEHEFSDPSEIFRANEVPNTEVQVDQPSPPTGEQSPPAFELSGDDVRTRASEMPANARDNTPIELLDRQTMQGGIDSRGRGRGGTSTSTSSRPAPGSPMRYHGYDNMPTSSNNHGQTQQRQASNNHPGNKPVQRSTMAVQAATTVMPPPTSPRKPVPANSGTRQTQTRNQPREPAQTADRSNHQRHSDGETAHNSVSHADPDQSSDHRVGDAHLDLESTSEHLTETQSQEEHDTLLKQTTAEDHDLSHDQGPLTEAQETGPIRKMFRSRKSKKAAHLQKAAPQSSGTSDWSISDQKRLAAFLKDHKVPKKPYLDPLSILLEWVPMKLSEADAEIELRGEELRRQTNANKLQRDAIIKLRTDLNSKERSEQKLGDDLIKLDQMLKSSNGDTALLRSNLEKSHEYAKAVQTKLDKSQQDLGKVMRDREKAQGECKQLRDEIKRKDEGFRQRLDSEIVRIQTEHSGKIQGLEYQIQQERGQHSSQVADLSYTHQESTRNMEAQWKQERDRLNRQIATAAQHHRDEMAQMKTAHQQEIDSRDTAMALAVNSHNEQLQEERDNHTATLNHLKATHEEKLKGVSGQLQAKIESLKRHMANYTSTDGYTSISDDDLRSNFQLLARRVNNLISWVPRPDDRFVVGQDLDPTGFLSRTLAQGGRSWPKFVRSICWRAITRGFFERQLGFGAFGARGTEGFDLLDQVYQLFAIPDPQDPLGPRVTIPNSKQANIGRASLFEALVKAIRKGTISSQDNRYIVLFQNNVASITNEIVSSLQRVSDNRLDPRAIGEISAFVEGLGLMALDMGSQRAHLYLETCEYGESIFSNELFKDDAEDGYGSLTVDLMTQPCIRRVGDGRENATVQRVIVKGDFVALKHGY